MIFNQPQKDGKAITSILVPFFQEFDRKVDDMFSNMETEFRSMHDCKEEKTNKLVIQETSLKKQLLKLEEKIDENDSYERQDTFVLSGTIIPLESNVENFPAVVCKLVKDVMKVSISASDISKDQKKNKN